MTSSLDQQPSGRRLFRGIQSRLILLLLTLVIPAVFMQAYIYNERFETRRAEELQANLEIARALAKTFRAFLQDVLSDELLIGHAFTSAQLSSNQDRERMLNKALAAHPAIWHLFWLDPAGTVVASTCSDFIGLDLGDRQYVREIVAGSDTSISNLIISKVTGQPTFTINRGVRDARGQLVGIIVASILPADLDSVLSIARAKGGGITLIDGQGMLVYRLGRGDFTWEDRNLLKKYPVFGEALKGNEITSTILTVSVKDERLVSLSPVESTGWAVAAGRPERDVMAAIKASLLPETMAFVIITMAAFGTALVFSRKISASIRQLRKHALALGRGETQNPVAGSGTTELNDLAEAFNKMSLNMQLREKERQLTEQALRENEERLRLAQKGAGIGVWDWNPATGVHNRTPELNLLYGTDAEGITTYEEWRKRVHPDDIERFETQRDEAVARHEPFDLEFRFFHSSCEIRWMSVRGRTVYNDEGEIVRVLGVNIDITERKRIEERLREAKEDLEFRVEQRTLELQRANEELRQIPSKLISVQEEERKRVACELHDSIGQTLAAVKFWIETILERRDGGDPDAALSLLEQFIPVLQHSIDETRNIYMGLRPSMLDNMGLLVTLEWLRGEWMKLNPQFHIELELGIREEEIQEKLKLSIFRIAQEALNNIAKHSRAEWVDISFSKSGGGIELVVSDDGVGISPDRISQARSSGSLGLTVMRERAELTGGTLSVESNPGQGTTVRACWPNTVENQTEETCIIIRTSHK